MTTVLRAAFASVFLACSSAAAFANDYTVTKLLDTNDGVCDADCSLREAIVAANNHVGLDRVILGSGLTYSLSLGSANLPFGAIVPATGNIDITDSLTLEGNGSTVDGGKIDRVLDIESGASVTINNLTIKNGLAAGFLSLGGGIYVHSSPTALSSLVLNNSVVTGNGTAIENAARDDGGGIAVVGSFNPTTGVALRASLTVNNTNVSANSGWNGGGILCVLCTLVGANATVSGNTSASGDGGGIAIVGNASSASINGGTLNGNTGALRGGALSAAYGTAAVGLTRNRIVSNTAGTGSALFNGTATITAANNWWGCNFGPDQTGPGCAATANGVAGVVTTTPYLVLRAAATPAALTMPSTSSFLVDTTINSANVDVSSGGTLPNGIDIALASTLGVLSNTTAVTSGGKATNVFSAGGVAGTAILSASIDNQTVSATIAIGAPAFRRRLPNDVDGDGLADLIVWRAPTGTVVLAEFVDGLRLHRRAVEAVGIQAAGDVPFVGDIDGDGIADLIVWRASTGTWYWLTSSTNYSYASQGLKQWGNGSLGDVPKIADMDGDGKVNLVVWRPGTGTWFWLTSSSGYNYAAQRERQWGNQSLGDVPLLGDFDGDGMADLAVWRATTGTWYWLTSSSNYVTGPDSRQWGSQAQGDIPMLADLDGDSRVELTVWRPGTGTWYALTSSSGYSVPAAFGKQWGASGDVPLLSDLDGDGRAELVVWRPSVGQWFWLTSLSGYSYNASGLKQWGSAGAGDIPIVK